MQPDNETLTALALAFDDLPLDCDGTSDKISEELEREGIPHTRMAGYVYDKERAYQILPHCWIELADGRIIDIRMRKWLPYRDNIPHGCFEPVEHLEYVGIEEKRTRFTDR